MASAPHLPRPSRSRRPCARGGLAPSTLHRASCRPTARSALQQSRRERARRSARARRQGPWWAPICVSYFLHTRGPSAKVQVENSGPMDESLRAVADPTRRQILRLVRDEELPAGTIAGHFPTMSRPAVSQHLRVLVDAGLLTVRPDG